MGKYLREIEKILDQNKGFITSTGATEAGIPRRCLSELASQGKLQKIDRGLYAVNTAWTDQLYYLQYRYTKGIYSHDTALYIHNIIKNEPKKYTMTFPHGYNTRGLTERKVNPRLATEPFYAIGITTMPSPSGNLIRVYDQERAICDLIRNENDYELEFLADTMKTYALEGSNDIAKLRRYAHIMRLSRKVDGYIRNFLE